MPYVSGKHASIAIDGDTLGGMVDWEAFIEEDETVKTSGQGDDWSDEDTLTHKWRGRATLELHAATDPSYMNKVTSETLPFVGKIDDDEAGAYLAGNIKITSAGVRVARKEKVTIPVEFRGKGEPDTIT